MKKKRNYKFKNEEKRCSPDCIYYPIEVCKNVEYKVIDGVKHRVNTPQYICGYDDKIIIHFKHNCPYKKVINKRKVIQDERE